MLHDASGADMTAIFITTHSGSNSSIIALSSFTSEMSICVNLFKSAPLMALASVLF